MWPLAARISLVSSPFSMAVLSSRNASLRLPSRCSETERARRGEVAFPFSCTAVSFLRTLIFCLPAPVRSRNFVGRQVSAQAPERVVLMRYLNPQHAAFFASREKEPDPAVPQPLLRPA